MRVLNTIEVHTRVQLNLDMLFNKKLSAKSQRISGVNVTNDCCSSEDGISV